MKNIYILCSKGKHWKHKNNNQNLQRIKSSKKKKSYVLEGAISGFAPYRFKFCLFLNAKNSAFQAQFYEIGTRGI